MSDFNNGFRLTGLTEFHGNLNGAGNLKIFAGFGGHLGCYSKGGKDGIMVGIDAVGGLDYKFRNSPINISLGLQPSYQFATPGTDFQADRGGLAVRVFLVNQE